MHDRKKTEERPHPSGHLAPALLALGLAACAGRMSGAAVEPPAAASLSERPKAEPGDERGATARGVEFQVPSGWVLHSQGALRRLQRPGAELTIAVFDSEASSAGAAVTEAWSALRPGLQRRVKGSSTGTAREGWALAQDYAFESAPGERRVALAMVLSQASGGPFTVVALDADEADFGRRLADVEQVFGSIRPPGYRAESFAGKAANELDAARDQGAHDSAARQAGR